MLVFLHRVWPGRLGLRRWTVYVMTSTMRRHGEAQDRAEHPVDEPADDPAERTRGIVGRLLGGMNVVSGQHNKEPASSPSQYIQQVRTASGQFPGRWVAP